jgi:glycosyltransferase involved in cell wall biosynthesis
MRAPVSVIVPCYRCHETIERAVASIAQQTLLPEEVLLIEDCSDDEEKTLDSLYRLQLEYRDKVALKIIALEANGGPSVARNTGWEAATASYIAFLDADDAWHPRKLEIQLAWMKAHPEAAMSGTQTTVRDTLGNLPKHSEPFGVKEATFGRMLFVNMLPTRSVIIRASVPNRFSPGKRYSEDYLLWLSILAEGHKAFLLELPLAYSFKPNFGVAGLSSHLWRMHCEVLDTYRRLQQAGHISGPLRIALDTYSLMKFFRRLALSC